MTVATDQITLGDIQKARQRVSSSVRRTPLQASATLSQRLGANVYVKLELFQKTGSFKVRGVFNKALDLGETAREKGLVTVSGGNHGQAVAYVARKLGTKAVLFMPHGAPMIHQEACRDYGAEIQFASTGPVAFGKVAEQVENGLTYIPPFDDPLIMAGQGTLGLEILEDAPQVTDIVLGIGGGGLMTGVATAIKTLKPDVRIWGAETEGANCMAQSLAAGKIVSLDAIQSVARSLGAQAPSEATFEAAKTMLEKVITVPDAAALAEQQFLLERLKVLAEPAASVVVAAAEQIRHMPSPRSFSKTDHVVLVLGGGNASGRLADRSRA